MNQDVDLNEGVQIILNRMKTSPEEFFGDGGRWNWIFKETLREVMTEIEKAALYEGLKQVRRIEISAKAAATVLMIPETEETEYGQTQASKLIINPSQLSAAKKLAGQNYIAPQKAIK